MVWLIEMIDYDDILENGKLTTDDKAFHVDNITPLCMHLNSNAKYKIGKVLQSCRLSSRFCIDFYLIFHVS